MAFPQRHYDAKTSIRHVLAAAADMINSIGRLVEAFHEETTHAATLALHVQ